jgi:hypothetical protein
MFVRDIVIVYLYNFRTFEDVLGHSIYSGRDIRDMSVLYPCIDFYEFMDKYTKFVVQVMWPGLFCQKIYLVGPGMNLQDFQKRFSRDDQHSGRDTEKMHILNPEFGSEILWILKTYGKIIYTSY